MKTESGNHFEKEKEHNKHLEMKKMHLIWDI